MILLTNDDIDIDDNYCVMKENDNNDMTSIDQWPMKAKWPVAND